MLLCRLIPAARAGLAEAVGALGALGELGMCSPRAACVKQKMKKRGKRAVSSSVAFIPYLLVLTYVGRLE